MSEATGTLDKLNGPQTAETQSDVRQAAASNPALGRSAECLLLALAARAAALAAGRPPASLNRVGKTELEALVSADLATRRADGTLAITQAGMAHLARLEFARH